MAYVKKEYQETDPYNSAYSDTITELTGKVSNGEKFDFNPLTDAAYQSYASQYGRLGKEARQNTLADVSNNTGGLASSYATTAAMQAQNVYDQALTDKIPELEALAYDKFNTERNYNLNALGAIQGIEDSAYGKWADNRDYNRNNYEFDQSFDYQNYRDQESFDYQKDRDKVEDSQFDKTFGLDLKNYELNKQQQTFTQKLQKDQFAYQKAMEIWTTNGKATTYVAKILGVKKGAKTSEQSYKDADIALNYAQLAKSGSSGGSRSSGGSGGKSYQVDTPYYQGNLNPDAKKGTFSNGYQPNNVGGNKLKKTGESVTFKTTTRGGHSNNVTQNIWKTSNGTKYYWDGRKNKYIKFKG